MPGDRVERYVLIVAAAGSLAVASAAAWALRSLAAWTWQSAALLCLLAVAYFLLQRRGFILRWRSQRLVTTLDEPVVFISLVALPWPAGVAAVFLGTVFAQAAARRRPIKALFNIASYALAAALASAAFGVLTFLLAMDPLLAAVLATCIYTLSSDVLTAGVLARAEGAATAHVLRQRFLFSTMPNTLLGSTLGFVALVLWGFHPAATLALAPLAALALGFARLNAEAERTLEARQYLADMTTALIGTSDEERVVARILDACGELFHAGRAELSLAGAATPARRERSREFEGGVADGGQPLRASLLGREGGSLGELRVWPSARVRGSLGAGDGTLLRVVAGKAAAALESAGTLRELIEAHKAADAATRSQTLTRPFVRRLVLSIVSRMNAPRNVITEVGRGLAELDVRTIAEFTEGFREMGLGNLHLDRRDGESYVFTADDLLERQNRSKQPTCHLALGFVEGAVAALHGASLGSELRCQSQGHPVCVFVVQPRALPLPRSPAARRR